MTNIEMEMIKAQIDKVITYSQDISNPKTDYVMEQWAKNKQRFINKMNGKLIYEFPEEVSFELSNEEKRSRISNFIYNLETKWGLPELGDFIHYQSLDNVNCLFDNITTVDYKSPDGKIIRKGTKMLRAFKHFVSDARRLHTVQTEASRIIQETKISGTMCVSVHPLDFLSISETAHHWRSCHSLDGDYRVGNISYMMDDCTFVCYLKSKEDTFLPNFPGDIKWNAKKWRVLLYLSHDETMMFAGKQYPFNLDKAMDFVLKTLLCQDITIAKNDEGNLFYHTSWSEWAKPIDNEISIKYLNGETETAKVMPSVIVEGRIIPIKHLVKDAEGSKQYNDVVYSSSYEPIYAFKRYNSAQYVVDATSADKTTFAIGHKTMCLKCGEYEALLGGGTMMCCDCEEKYGCTDNEDFTFCECCERHILIDEAYYVEGNYVCSRCVETETVECADCGELFFKENIHYCEEKEDFICDYCWGHEK